MRDPIDGPYRDEMMPFLGDELLSAADMVLGLFAGEPLAADLLDATLPAGPTVDIEPPLGG